MLTASDNDDLLHLVVISLCEIRTVLHGPCLAQSARSADCGLARVASVNRLGADTVICHLGSKLLCGVSALAVGTLHSRKALRRKARMPIFLRGQEHIFSLAIANAVGARADSGRRSGKALPA